MNKPLSEWTLAEVKAECVKRNSFCEADGTCPFFVLRSEKLHCKIMNDVGNAPPKIWDLSEPPRWAEQDKEDARKIKAIFPDDYSLDVGRLDDGRLKLVIIQGLSFVLINDELLPSLKPGKSATLDEIIGGGE